VANVSLLDARTISVQPWEKGMGAKIEKAIRESDLGLNPASMGDLIRVPMPPMSEERRKEMTKLCAQRRRKRQDRHAQPAPRRQRIRQEAGQGQTRVRRRPKARRNRGSEVHRQAHRRDRSLVAGKEQEIMAV
jgi:ribosome recycling factor